MLTLCSGVDAKWGVGLNIAGHAEWNSKCWTGATADADVCLLSPETEASGVSESYRTIIDALLEKWGLIFDKDRGSMEQQVHASGHVFTGDYARCTMKSSFPLPRSMLAQLQFLTWAVGLFAPRQLMFHNHFARRVNQHRTAGELSRFELLECAEVSFRRSHVERLAKRVKDCKILNSYPFKQDTLPVMDNILTLATALRLVSAKYIKRDGGYFLFHDYDNSFCSHDD